MSLGTGPFGGVGDEAAVAIFMEAASLGVNLVDTSPLYGAGESGRRLGLALRAYLEGGGRREDLLVCTKTGTRNSPFDYSGDATRRSIDASLAALGLDYLDLVHVAVTRRAAPGSDEYQAVADRPARPRRSRRAPRMWTHPPGWSTVLY